MKLYFNKFLFIGCAIFIVFIEDLLRRIMPGNQIWLVLMKTYFLMFAFIVNGIYFNLPKYMNVIKYWFIVFTLILFFYIFFHGGLVRFFISFHSLIVIPLLCLLLMYRLSKEQNFAIYKFVLLSAFIAALVALYTYLSGLYTSVDSWLGPTTETAGFRIFDETKIYFNAGWFYGAERLAWICAIAISIGFVFINCYKGTSLRFFIYLCILILFAASVSTFRTTGMLLCLVIVLVNSFKILIKRRGYLFALMLLLFLGLILFDNASISLDHFNPKYLFYVEHISTFFQRVSIQVDNINRGMQYGGFFGLGPMPQGLQYFSAFGYTKHVFHTEGLISHSIAQYGFFSLFHIGFHFFLIYLGILGIFFYDDWKFSIALLLVISRIWLLKASQMETDTFAQFTLYVIVASYLFHIMSDHKRIIKLLLTRKRIINVNHS